MSFTSAPPFDFWKAIRPFLPGKAASAAGAPASEATSAAMSIGSFMRPNVTRRRGPRSTDIRRAARGFPSGADALTRPGLDRSPYLGLRRGRAEAREAPRGAGRLPRLGVRSGREVDGDLEGRGRIIPLLVHVGHHLGELL